MGESIIFMLPERRVPGANDPLVLGGPELMGGFDSGTP